MTKKWMTLWIGILLCNVLATIYLLNEHNKEVVPETMVETETEVVETESDLNVLFLGDSITELDEEERGWIRYFKEILPCETVANVSVSGAVWTDYKDTKLDGEPKKSEKSSNTLCNQVTKVLNNSYEVPDIIIIAIGTNGGIDPDLSEDTIRKAYYDGEDQKIPVDECDRTTTTGAFRYTNEKLLEKYPNALIFWCTPIQANESRRKVKDIVRYEQTMEKLTAYAGLPLIRTNRCFFNGTTEINREEGFCLIDGLHPNAEGAKRIGYYNACEILTYLPMIDKMK